MAGHRVPEVYLLGAPKAGTTSLALQMFLHGVWPAVQWGHVADSGNPGPGWRGLGLATFRGGLDEEAGHRQARRVSPRRGAGGRRSTPRVRMRTKHRPNLRGVTRVSIWERSGDQGSWSAMFFLGDSDGATVGRDATCQH